MTMINMKICSLRVQQLRIYLLKLTSKFSIYHIIKQVFTNISNFFRKQTKMHLNNNCNFILTPKSGYFKNCISEESFLENNIDLSNFSILTNNHITETSLKGSTNVSKVVYCNETLYEDKLNQSQDQSYSQYYELLFIYILYKTSKTHTNNIHNQVNNLSKYIVEKIVLIQR